MCKASLCKVNSAVEEVEKAEIMNPGGGKSLKSRIVHGHVHSHCLSSPDVFIQGKISPILLICTMTYSPHYVPCL